MTQKQNQCDCGSERAILKDGRCINCTLSPRRQEKKCCKSCWDGDRCTKTMCDCHSVLLTWEEKEREDFESQIQDFPDEFEGFFQVIFEYFLSRIKAAREEGRIMERREYGNAYEKGWNDGLDKISVETENIREEPETIFLVQNIIKQLKK